MSNALEACGMLRVGGVSALMVDWIQAAREARERAYAPYSKFKVGAALVDAAGEVHIGCNVENISYGLAMCAERVAIGTAISRNVTEFQAIVVVADTDEPVSPCGACRQVLAEFNPGLKVILATTAGRIVETTLSELLPRAKTGILNHS